MKKIIPRRARNALLALVVVILVALGVHATDVVFASRYPGANDFFPKWVGGRALLREGLSPYSEEVTLRIQQGMYGRPARPDEDQAAFIYPLYSLLFYFPLCAVDDYALVQAIWLWLLLVALLAAIAISMQVIRWQPQRWLGLVVLLWTVLMYYSFRALILGQFSVWVFLALVSALWAVERGHDGWAGLLLALSTVKPQLVYLAIFWILLWAAGQRRWRLWVGFTASMAGLILGSMLLVPAWIPDFVRQVIAYPTYTVYGSLTWIIVQQWLGLGPAVEYAATALLILGTLILGWRLWRADYVHMLWLLGLLLIVTNLVTPRISTTNYILLIPYVLWGLREIQTRWSRWGTWAIAGLLAASFVGLWALFFNTLQGNFERWPVYLPFPLAVGLLLPLTWRSVQGWDEKT
jgi:hypothetical protein